MLEKWQNKLLFMQLPQIAWEEDGHFYIVLFKFIANKFTLHYLYLSFLMEFGPSLLKKSSREWEKVINSWFTLPFCSGRNSKTEFMFIYFVANKV